MNGKSATDLVKGKALKAAQQDCPANPDHPNEEYVRMLDVPSKQVQSEAKSYLQLRKDALNKFKNSLGD